MTTESVKLKSGDYVQIRRVNTEGDVWLELAACDNYEGRIAHLAIYTTDDVENLIKLLDEMKEGMTR